MHHSDCYSFLPSCHCTGPSLFPFSFFSRFPKNWIANMPWGKSFHRFHCVGVADNENYALVISLPAWCIGIAEISHTAYMCRQLYPPPHDLRRESIYTMFFSHNGVCLLAVILQGKLTTPWEISDLLVYSFQEFYSFSHP